MNLIDTYFEKVNELLDGVDRGDFMDASVIPQQYTYGHLMALYQLSGSLNDGKKK